MRNGNVKEWDWSCAKEEALFSDINIKSINEFNGWWSEIMLYVVWERERKIEK